MNKIYVAVGQNVFVKEIEEQNKIGSFVIPDSTNSDFTYGEIITCSEGYFENGNFVPVNLKNGDKIAFPKICGAKVTLNDMEVIKLSVRDIVAVQVDGEIDKGDIN